MIIFAATNGFLDAYPVAECRRYEKELYSLPRRCATRELLKAIAREEGHQGRADRPA